MSVEQLGKSSQGKIQIAVRITDGAQHRRQFADEAIVCILIGNLFTQRAIFQPPFYSYPMLIQEAALLLFSVIFAVSGQFLLKAGALKLGQVTSTNALSHILSIAVTPELVLGLLCYAIGSLTYILLLTRVDLSVAGPAVALSYVFSVLVGTFVFHESLPSTRLFGVGCIVCGVLLVVWQK